MESSDETTLAPYSYWYCPPEGKSSSRPRQFQISRLREVTSSKKHFVCKGVRRQPVQALARTGPELKHHLVLYDILRADLESRQPPVMRVIHRPWLGKVELDCRGTDLRFLRGYLAAVPLRNDEPRMIGTDAGAIPIP
jgi:hypothetical protein